MIEEWLGTSWTQVWLVVVSTVAIFAAVVIAVRLNGLRSFSKMSSFDFAVTVAIGSLIASVAISSSSLANGVIALAVVLAAQRVVARLRRWTQIENVIDNTPMLLMAGHRMLEDNMAKVRVTPADVRAKLREANVTQWTEVRAVVLETTGDVSVLHGDQLDSSLLEGVIGVESLAD